jgi:hypothetical protein
VVWLVLAVLAWVQFLFGAIGVLQGCVCAPWLSARTARRWPRGAGTRQCGCGT